MRVFAIGAALKNELISAARAVWRRIPRHFRFAAWVALKKLGVAPPLRRPSARSSAETIKPGPIIVSGFISDTRGVAQTAILAIRALRQAGYCVIEHDISYLLKAEEAPAFQHPAEGGVWILYCNPPEAKVIMHQHPALANAPLYRIGAWAWELSTAPKAWIDYASVFHEIWALTTFQASAFDSASVPTRVMSPPVQVQSSRFRADPALFTITHVSDFRSSLARKNPMAALAAYLEAFALDDGAQLLMKLSASESNPSALEQLMAAAAGRHDVKFLSEHLHADEMNTLLEDSDIVISLHRAEGFGLPLAEAMSMGKAVVTTGWSGVMDFVPDVDGAQLVSYTLVPVEDLSELYRGGYWAEPDVRAAAEMLKRLRRDHKLRARAGAENRVAIAKLALMWNEQNLRSSFARFADCNGPETASERHVIGVRRRSSTES